MHKSKYQYKNLSDLGEKRIIDELIKPRFPSNNNITMGIGDDCAVIPTPPPDHELVFTTDPCPTPVICMLEPKDLYHYGRMTALINISDLAAMGAKPLGILISTVMPEKMPVCDYERFLDGLQDACNEWSCPVIGGNIKDGPEFTATGSAVGAVKKNLLMRRTGAKQGDMVCVIGEMGIFWAAILSRMTASIKVPPSYREILDSALYRPRAKLHEALVLSKMQKATSCMDSSDGISGCLHELSASNNVDIVIDSNLFTPHQVVQHIADQTDIDARKLMLSWGNWELVCTIHPKSYDEIKMEIESLGTPFHLIGHVKKGTGNVWLEYSGLKGMLTNFASERFCDTSFFTHGLDTYLDFLKTSPITVGT